jgi:adenylate cyclase
VAHWVIAMRGRSLARAGRLQEAQSAWRELLESGEPVDATVEAIAHLGHVEYAWCESDASLACSQSERMSDLAGKRQVPYLRVIAQFCAGVTATISGQLSSALPALTSALSLLRAKRVATEFEPEILAALAECELRSGELDAARGHVAEAIRLSRARGARIAECRALIIHGLAHGVDGSGMHEDSFVRAERLIAETGAVSYHAPLRRAREDFGNYRQRLRVGQ